MNDNLQLIKPEAPERKAYSAPAIVHELKLETRAGSPLRPELTDPLGIDPTKPQVN
ncbi:MAG TPA: hypothetical protein VMP08_17865 [Anaerolineae bacterium]|nr:hypothetical protein [Anaerolineae bacterium]